MQCSHNNGNNLEMNREQFARTHPLSRYEQKQKDLYCRNIYVFYENMAIQKIYGMISPTVQHNHEKD